MTQHRITDKSKDKMTECTRTREQATITRDRMIDILNPLFMHRKSFDHWLNISVGTLEWVHYMSRYAHQYEEDTDSLLDIVGLSVSTEKFNDWYKKRTFKETLLPKSIF